LVTLTPMRDVFQDQRRLLLVGSTGRRNTLIF
jgi:hypothetical protein